MKGTEQGKTFLVSPSPTTQGRQSGEKRTAPLHCNNPHVVLELPELWAAAFPWGQLVFSPLLPESESELMFLKEMMKNLCSQLSCYNKNSIYEPNCLLFCVCLGNLEQNDTAQHANISSEAIWLWKSSEAQKETMTALCYQSARALIADRTKRGTAAALNSHWVPKTLI